MCSRLELKLIFDLSYVNLLFQTTLFCVLIVLFEQVVLVGDIRLPATNVYRMLYSYQAKDKCFKSRFSPEPAEQTTDVASVAEDIDDTEYELPPGQYQMFFDYIHVDSEFFIKFR